MTFLIFLIFFNFSLLIFFAVMIIVSAIPSVIKFRKQDSAVKLKSPIHVDDLKSFFITNRWVLIALTGSLILSSMRALFIDPPIVINDGYELYAQNLKILLTNWNYDIDQFTSGYRHTFRTNYSLLIAMISFLFPFLDTIIIGRIISVSSFIISIVFLSKILNNFKTLSIDSNKQKILILFILNPTIITNVVRLETDIIFLALSLYIINIYIDMKKQKTFSKSKIIKLLIGFTLLFLTRQVGAILITVIIIHYLYSASKEAKAFFLFIFIGIIAISALLGVLSTILFHAIWSATSYDNAIQIVQNFNFSVLVNILLSKFIFFSALIKTVESMIYAFIPALFFAIIGLINLYWADKNRIKRVFRTEIALFFILYLIFYLFFKTGRGLDRFWIPILIFPLLILPFTIDLQKTFKNVNYFLKMTDNPQMQNLSFFGKVKIFSLPEINSSSEIIFPKSTFILILFIQLFIFGIRTGLSLFITIV